jgi:hypothetical protein
VKKKKKVKLWSGEFLEQALNLGPAEYNNTPWKRER